MRFPIVYIVFEIKNTLRTLKASFSIENKNMKPSKKNDVLIKKKSVDLVREKHLIIIIIQGLSLS